jgi:rhodanese-related sulfurtransferase
MDTTMIQRDELKTLLRTKGAKVFMATKDEWAYLAAHIPGTLPAGSVAGVRAIALVDEPIVVYCTGVACARSVLLARWLTQAGYRNVRRYAGGLEDWANAGEPLDGRLSA